MSTDAREVEWQFDVLDLRPVVRWLTDPETWGELAAVVQVAPARSVTYVDLYLDTNDRRFHRAGYGLRIRRAARNRDDGGEATLKSLEPASADLGLRNRREVSEQLARADPAALLRSTGLVGERVRAVAGRKRLLSLFEVRTRRRRFSVSVERFPPGEIVLDEAAIRPPDGRSSARLRRVELELPERTLAPLEAFVDEMRAACGLQPARLSKYEAGLLSANIRLPRGVRLGPTEIEADATIGAVALAVLRRHFSALLAKEPGTRLGDDIEQLHDMRVASRRLRAALTLFADVLPPSGAELRAELGWIGKTLGAVRDVDVQLEQLDGWLVEIPEIDRGALTRLRSLLEQQRAMAREAMLEVFDSRRYAAFVTQFGRLVRVRAPSRSGHAALPARSVAPELVELRFRQVRKAASQIRPDSEPAEYHRLRIRCKRFRYALEFVADVYPDHTRPLIRRLAALQDVLGLHQDAEVAIDRLRRLAAERGGELEPTTIFAMGEIAERYRNSMGELRARYPAAYARATGKAWKSFRKVLEDQRPSPALAGGNGTGVAPDEAAP